MIITNPRFNQLLGRHKAFISTWCYRENKEDMVLIHQIKDQAIRLCLFYADYKCQDCGTSDKLTIHHFIKRYNKKFLDFERYISIRYYWNNSIILCVKCHAKEHNLNQIGMKYFDDKFIEKVKKWFENAGLQDIINKKPMDGPDPIGREMLRDTDMEN